MTTSYEDMDEPNTLSPVTYHIQIGSYGDSSNRQIRWNKPHHDAAHLDASVMKSMLIAEEVMGSKALVSHNGYSFNMQPDIIFANRFPESGGVTKMDIYWETPTNFPIGSITNTNTSVYSYDAGKITVLQDGYYRAVFRIGSSSLNNSNNDPYREVNAAIGISTDGGASYTTLLLIMLVVM